MKKPILFLVCLFMGLPPAWALPGIMVNCPGASTHGGGIYILNIDIWCVWCFPMGSANGVRCGGHVCEQTGNKATSADMGDYVVKTVGAEKTGRASIVYLRKIKDKLHTDFILELPPETDTQIKVIYCKNLPALDSTEKCQMAEKTFEQKDLSFKAMKNRYEAPWPQKPGEFFLLEVVNELLPDRNDQMLKSR